MSGKDDSGPINVELFQQLYDAVFKGEKPSQLFGNPEELPKIIAIPKEREDERSGA